MKKLMIVVIALLTSVCAISDVTNTKKVLFLGDSITDKRHIGCTKNYWGFLGEKYGFNPIVYGANGHQMRHIVEQAKKFQSENTQGADVIFVFAGTNDFNANVPLGEWYSFSKEEADKDGKKVMLRKRTFVFDSATFRGRINQTLLYLKENFPDAKIIMMTPVHRGYAMFGATNVQPDESYANTLGLFLDDYVAAIKEAGNIWSVKIVDLHATSGLMPNLRSQDKYISKTMSDRLHPSTLGHERMAAAISLEVGDWLK